MRSLAVSVPIMKRGILALLFLEGREIMGFPAVFEPLMTKMRRRILPLQNLYT